MSSKTSEKLSLPTLRSKMKVDPEGYEAELGLIYNQFNSSIDLFNQQAALNFNSLSGIGTDAAVAKDLGDRAMFLAHMTQFYPRQLSPFPNQLAEFLTASASSLPSSLRCKVSQALILLMNRKAVDLEDMLSLFMELQTLGDKRMRKLAFDHVIHSIRRTNQNHKNEAKKRALQKILLPMLRRDEESIAKSSLVVVCDLHRRKVWDDESTANEICQACFHHSPKIRKAALRFLLDYEKIEDNGDTDGSSSEDEEGTHNPQIIVNKEDVYKAHHKGTTSSKKKKKAKLKRVVRCMKRRQRLTSESCEPSYYSPLNHLRDAHAVAERLLSLFRDCNQRFEVKMMLLKVIARTIGLHRLCLPNFYTSVENYVRPHQSDVTSILASVVQACHDMVPPDVVEPLMKTIVREFINTSPEAVSIGLNEVREICLRMPLLMTEALLQDLVLYKKEKGKAVSSAARSLLALFRVICPSLLRKKDRGRPIDPKARPKAFGEFNVASNVPGIELLAHDDHIDNGSDENDEDDADEEMESESESEMEESTSSEFSCSDDEEVIVSHESQDSEEEKSTNRKKRKSSNFDEQINSADVSLRALKRLASAKMGKDQLDSEDGILSNEDFKRIRVLKTEAEAEAHGFLKKGSDSKSGGGLKIPDADQLAIKRVDPAKLVEGEHRKMSKDERMALVKAGREDGHNYQARTALKQKKKGGMSNKQKEHKKFMPTAAKRSKIVRSRISKKKKNARSGKQFRGKKAWK